MKQKKAGRPPKKTGPKNNWKFTPEVLGKLEYAFSIDCSVTEACYYAGITTETFYRWKKDNKQLYDAYERLRSKPILKARETVVNNIKDPDTAKWYLERKRKNEFSPKTINVNENFNGEMDEEHKKRVDEILKKYNQI